ncbi:MAG: carboxypeptidase-like regulatory domain-containing protein [candidate division KSB1 bacterium]|nr:carboxypeptidase-like regulatory domain-containing protein [candidate division KSB1 bacterium]
MATAEGSCVMKLTDVLVMLLVVSVASISLAGTTGKIVGTVTDKETKAPLPGVNVIIEGTAMGAATNLQGYYVILNVPPGIYTVRASMIGYARVSATQVRVSIDQTTTVDFALEPQTLMGQEVTVVAERPVVQKDVSASVATLNFKEIEALPMVRVAEVVGLEAGVIGLTIRGGGSEQTNFVVNGFSLRDERTFQPYTGISYTSVDEIKIQTGGFSAEFGNIRSGLINVVTKEGRRDKYTLGFIGRYRPPAPKHFGHAPYSRDSYWIRPYVDDAVCWTGTKNGAWDEYMQKQFVEFEGWNAVSAKTLANDDPNDDLSPAAAQQVFLWEHRRILEVRQHDYDVDMSFGGPVPVVSEYLGGLRFFASYRRTREMYVVPLSTDFYRDYHGQLKLTSDLRPGLKLMVEGMLGEEFGTNDNNSGLAGIFRSPEGIADALSNGPKYIDGRMFGDAYWCPSTYRRNSIGAKLTHVLSPATFYEVTLQRYHTSYDTNPGRARDTSRVYLFGNNYWVDEAPFGYQPAPSTGIVGLRMGVGMSNSRDSSKVTVWSLRADFTSQVNRSNNIKTGVELVYTDNNVNYASVDKFLPSGRSKSKWHTYPVRGAVYVQDNLEFEGMIANVGLRLDYSHAGGEWYVYDPFTRAFSAERSLGIDTLLAKEPTKRIFELSPRLGVAFPITVNSKLYFNYGHFRQLPLPENLFLLRRYTDNNAVTRVADPNNPLPRTVAYELGYEHNLFNQFLLRLAGYYKDASLQSRLVTYVSRDNKVNYSVTKPYNYQDTRGFELTLRKNRGPWVQGFVNYTYEVTTAGNFGFGTYYENPAEQRRYERETRSHYQEKPVPRPYSRANVDFFTPPEFGPKVLGLSVLGDWRLNVLAVWRSGYHFTWTGGGTIPGIQYNVQWRDYYNVDLRLTKNFRLGFANLELFVDVYNVFNIKYMTNYGFVDGKDYEAYMKSLHLPAGIGNRLAYGNIPGNDRPGDFRKDGVKFQPMEFVADMKDVSRLNPKVIYYDKSRDNFFECIGGQWVMVPEPKIRKLLDEKAHIDMPNQQYFTFLHPRDVYWGIRLWVNY